MEQKTNMEVEQDLTVHIFFQELVKMAIQLNTDVLYQIMVRPIPLFEISTGIFRTNRKNKHLDPVSFAML